MSRRVKADVPAPTESNAQSRPADQSVKEAAGQLAIPGLEGMVAVDSKKATPLSASRIVPMYSLDPDDVLEEDRKLIRQGKVPEYAAGVPSWMEDQMTFGRLFTSERERYESGKRISETKKTERLGLNCKMMAVNLESGKTIRDAYHTKTTEDYFALLRMQEKAKQARSAFEESDRKEPGRINIAEFVDRLNAGEKVRLRASQKGLSDEGIRRIIREDFFSGASGDNNFTPFGRASFNSEYAPSVTGPFYKQMYLQDLLANASRCFEAYHHNPICYAAMNMKKTFVIGTGVQIMASDDTLQKEADDFIQMENFDEELDRLCLDLGNQGELFARWYDKPSDSSRITFRMLDNATIWEIITNPEDYRDIKAYWQSYASPYQMTTIGNAPIMEYYNRYIPPEEIDHVKINCSASEKRGRPDASPALTYMKWWKDVTFARMVQEKVRATWLWELIVKGHIGDIRKALALFPNPQNPGSVFGHNESITLDAKGPQFGQMNRSQQNDVLRDVIAVSLGIIPEWVGGKSATRSGALLSAEPPGKHFQDRQTVLKRFIQIAFVRVFLKAIEAGRLPTSYLKDPTRLLVNPVFPEISKDDTGKRIELITDAMQLGALDEETGFDRIATELGVLNYDYDKTQAKILELRKKGQFGYRFTQQYPNGVFQNPNSPSGAGAAPLSGPDIFNPDQKPAAALPAPQVPAEDKPSTTKAPKEPLDIQNQKDEKANPMGSGAGALKKSLKNANRKLIAIPLRELDV